MMGKIEIVTVADDAVARLDALQVRGEVLRREIADCDRDEPRIQASITKAERAARNSTAGGFYDANSDLVDRLHDAEAALADLIARRDEAKAELSTIPEQRVAIVRETAPEAWEQYVRAKDAQLDAGLEVAQKVAPLVEKYTVAAEHAEKTKASLDRLLKPLGLATERVLGDFRRVHPEPELPEDPEMRQALRRACRMRIVYAEDLTYRW